LRSQYFCEEGHYSPLATVLLSPCETITAALWARGMPHSLPPAVLAAGLAAWFLGAALASTAAVPAGMLVPQMVIGGLLGRLYGLGVREVRTHGADLTGMFGVCGAAAVLAGSGRLRLFLTSLMLEMTSQALSLSTSYLPPHSSGYNVWTQRAHRRLRSAHSSRSRR
jgi:H+/Cl- antiporter ClcA